MSAGRINSNLWLAILIVVALTTACGPAGPGPDPAARSAETSDLGRQAPRGSITIAWAREPENLSPKFLGGAGGAEPSWVFSSALTYYDLRGVPHPMMANRIPTQENGDWIINPDGTMVTTYRLRQGMRWHDGTPLTAHDFAFAARVYADPDVPVANREPERHISSVDAPDDTTLVVTWAEPYVQANVLGRGELPPLPTHILEERYRTNRANFVKGEEWTAAFVGSGPFRLERWEPGTRLIGRAFPDWFLGPPRIETLEIRILPDPNTLMANMLAGDIDFTNSPSIRVSEAVIARDHWGERGEGYIKTWETRLKFLEFQYREVPNWQRAVTDARVRRGLLHAVDRGSLAEVMTQGLGTAADAWVLPSDPQLGEINRAVTKHPYDPNRALALLGEAGWTSQASGALANASGQPFEIEVNSGSSPPQEATIVADNWKRIGVQANVYILPSARQRDREFRASFPGVHTGERTIRMDDFHLITARIPTPETGFVESNRGSFSDAEVDRLYQIVLTSFDEGARRQATVAIHRRMSELAGYGPLYYGVEVLVARNRLKGPIGHYGPQTGVTWNVHEWEVSD
jgi:peptide/nickel transport system substrate-binding protein